MDKVRADTLRIVRDELRGPLQLAELYKEFASFLEGLRRGADDVNDRVSLEESRIDSPLTQDEFHIIREDLDNVLQCVQSYCTALDELAEKSYEVESFGMIQVRCTSIKKVRMAFCLS